MYHFNDNLIINFLCFLVYDGCILMSDMNQRYITGMVNTIGNFAGKYHGAWKQIGLLIVDLRGCWSHTSGL